MKKKIKMIQKNKNYKSILTQVNLKINKIIKIIKIIQMLLIMNYIIIMQATTRMMNTFKDTLFLLGQLKTIKTNQKKKKVIKVKTVKKKI